MKERTEDHLMKACAIVLLVIAGIVFGSMRSCDGAPPDPVFRMESPSGCSGGWFHASRKHGLWGATCSHCVATARQSVRLRLFKDGHRSPTVQGYCFAASRGHDASVVWVPPANYRYRELPLTFRLHPTGPRYGQTVFAVGSFAGGTVAPAARKVAVNRIGRYEFQLNDSAWGGHSGGAVVTERGELVGVLWGAGRGYSLVTSSRAIWETLYGSPRQRQYRPVDRLASGETSGQAFASVRDDLRPVADSSPRQMASPTVQVWGNTSQLERCGFLAEMRTNPAMQSIKWTYRGGNSVRFSWNDGQTRWFIEGWPGLEILCQRFARANGAWPVDYCPNCPPNYGNRYGGNYGRQNPLSPWNVVPPSPTAPPTPNEDTASAERVRELEEANRKAKREFEDKLRDLKHQQEDQLRELRLASEDALRKIREANRVPPATAEPEGVESPAEEDDDASDVVQSIEKAIAEREKQRRAQERIDRTLKDGVERIEQKGNRDWFLPAAVLAGLVVVGAGVAIGLKKG